MKRFSKQLSWLLAFVLIFTSMASAWIPVSAVEEPITIGEGTNEVIPAGKEVQTSIPILISYYESANSDIVLYNSFHHDGDLRIGIDYLAIKPYAWHITFEGKEYNTYITGGNDLYHFKAYPDTSLKDVPVGTEMAFFEDTTLTCSDSDISVYESVYVGTTLLTDYSTSSSDFTLPSASEIEEEYNDDLEDAGYKLPDLTKLYYKVELTAKSAGSYTLKHTLAPTVEVTFDENTGKPDLSAKKMYATPYAIIDGTKLPTVSLEGVDFYGWKNPYSSKYVYLANVTETNKNELDPLSFNKAYKLKAIFKEIKPTFKLDLASKKVTDLLPGRTYNYATYYWDTSYNITSDANGEFEYGELSDFESLAQLRLKSNETVVSLHSDSISLKHNTPNKPVVEYTATTARVTNEYDGCQFAVRATDDGNELIWGDSSELTGLTPEKEYSIFVKHKADENGFESLAANSDAFTTMAVKTVSNQTPNGVTIDSIPEQIHDGGWVEPTLVIKDGGTDLAEGIHYTVAYSDNIYAGTATATVTFMDNYSGTMTKSFTINHNWLEEWVRDETKHWHYCFGCTVKNDMADHTPGAAATAETPQTCTVCGYELAPALGSWIVSFDANGGTGTMPSVSVTKGGQYTLPVPTFTAPINKEFWAWNVGGTEYCPGTNCAIAENTTIRAVWKDMEVVDTPVISPNGGTFSGSQAVAITCGTTGARIYYTTDGTEPTVASNAYTEPFTISSSVTVKAIAAKDDMVNSGVASASFTKRSANSDRDRDEDRNPTPTSPTQSAPPQSTPPQNMPPQTEPGPTDNSGREVVLTIGRKEARVDGSDIINDVAPVIRNDRTMLPARFIAENLGAQVTWDGKKQEVIIKGNNEKGEAVTILISIGSDYAYVNGNKVKLDSPAFIENGRTYTPFRFIAETLGAVVEWIEAEQRVVIRRR